MTLLKIVGRAAAVLVLTTAASAPFDFAQGTAKPNFSGQWVIQSPEKSAGREQAFKHDSTTLTKGREGTRQTTYQLDGVERKTAIPFQGKEIVTLSKAAWEGDKLVITSHDEYPNGMKINTREVWSLDAQGILTIDVTETAEKQPPMSSKIVLRKKM